MPSETDAHSHEDGSIAAHSHENRRSSLPYNYISEADEAAIQAAIDKLPSQEAFPDDGAVILWDSVDINIDEKSRYIYSTRRVAKIFNEDGRGLAEISIPYMRGRDDVTIHHARTLTPDGKIVELDTDKIIRDVPPPSAVDAGLYVDARLMYFTLQKLATVVS